VNSYSQAGQDRFAYLLSGQKRDGTFLEVGAYDGYAVSNTLGLEEIGWTGFLLDIQCFPSIARRKAKFCCCDAAAADWSALLADWFPSRYVDYLSLDVDEATTTVLAKILKSETVFGIITIEHDKYRLGPAGQTIQRDLFLASGYDLVCSDVIVDSPPFHGEFEDWYCHKDRIPKDRRDRYRCNAQLGTTICGPAA
jgi:hypothetical protein